MKQYKIYMGYWMRGKVMAYNKQHAINVWLKLHPNYKRDEIEAI